MPAPWSYGSKTWTATRYALQVVQHQCERVQTGWSGEEPAFPQNQWITSHPYPQFFNHDARLPIIPGLREK